MTKDTTTKPDQRGTEQEPLIVKIAPTPKSEEDRANEAAERQRIAESDRKKEDSDTKLIEYTRELALFTSGLFWATTFLFLATLGLLYAAFRQSRDTQKIIEFTRDEFLATHRPRMRLKHAWFIDRTAWRIGSPLEINLDFVNIGSGTAYVTWINYQSILIPKNARLPQLPPYDEIPPSGVRITRFPSPAVVTSGVTLPRPVCDGILDNTEVHDILWGERTLYLIGTIEYWDAAKKHLRQTAFCRCLTYQKYPPDYEDMGRFCIVKDPDYEYED